MSLASNFLSLKLRILLVGIFSISCLMFMHGVAHAACAVPPVPSNTLPESCDFSQGNNVWLTIANQDGVNYLLNARTSVVRLYSSSPQITLTITSGRQCPGNGPDAGTSEGSSTSSSNARFDIYKLAPIPQGGSYNYTSAPYIQAGLEKTIYSFNLQCDNSQPITLSNGNVASGYPGYAQNGKYAWEIDASWLNLGNYGWNMFKYTVNIGRFSYYAGSGDHFAVKADYPGNPGSPGQFKFGFAPNCLLTSSQTAQMTVRWFDADAGQKNQNFQSPVKTALIEYDASNNQSGYPTINSVSGGTAGNAGVINITSGQNTGGSATFTIKGHHKYMWVWYNIYSANGIQFELPTDSYNTLIDFNTDCSPTGGPVAAQASCTATPSKVNPTVGTGITIKVTVKNTSASGGPVYDTSYQMRQIAYNGSPAGGARNLTTTLKPGQTDTGLSPFNISARASPQTVTFNYSLFDGSTAGASAVDNSPLCSTTVTWGAVKPQPSVQADCGSTTVTVPSGSILAQWLPPPNVHTGAATKITKVPAALIITEAGTTNSFTYLIPGGVDLSSGGSWTSPAGQGGTFGMWPGMWLHKSYTIQLAVQGTQAETSATYNNDGFWNPTNNANDGGYFYGINLFNTDTVSDCMSAYCGEPSPVDAEPGQTKNFSYGIHITNLSQRTYSDNDSNGYHFNVGTSGGIVNVSGVSATPDMTPGNPTDISVNFTARLDYTGNFWITFYFQGQALTQFIPTGTCGGGVDVPGSPGTPGGGTPATRAYFEVRGGDISTGGGFADAADVCPTTAPGYISPATGYSDTSGRYDYAGGDSGVRKPERQPGQGFIFRFWSFRARLGYW